MATNKIKFKMSIDKIAFEFEGDYEQGKAIQQGITSTLSGLSNMQNRVVGIDEKTDRKLIEHTVIEAAPSQTSKRRTRKRRSASTTTESSVSSQELSEQNDGSSSTEGPSQRRNTGASPITRLIELRQAQFFDSARTCGEIRTELHRRGFSSIRTTDLTQPLISLTQRDVLRREKDQQRNQWVYMNGSSDDAT